MKTMNRLTAPSASNAQKADRGCPLKITAAFRYHPLKIIMWVLLLLPAAGMSQEQTSDEDWRREWNEIQSSKSPQELSDWWQHLGPARLNKYLKAGVDVNISNKRKWTPLHSAARFNADAAVLAALLQAGAVVGAKNRAGDTPLHWAAAANTNVEIVKLLIEAGGGVNTRDRFGWTPIHTAAESSSNPAVIEALLAAGATRKKRAYFVLFRPAFLLKHNSNMSAADKKIAMALLEAAE